ncbi:hypothetical protein Tco_1319959 [Tanacetum coccineum]
MHATSSTTDVSEVDKLADQLLTLLRLFLKSCHSSLMRLKRFALRFKSLLMNKEKLLELAKIPFERGNCSELLLKKAPESLEIPASVLFYVFSPDWLSLPELTPTRMTFELADYHLDE